MDVPFERYDIEDYFEEAAQDECLEIAQEIVDEIRKSAVTGVKYVNRIPVDTGTLLRGYRAERTETGAEVVSDVEYRDYVEFGTQYMEAQPHVGPAVEVVRRRHRSGNPAYRRNT